jgi:hypothetical protein
VAIRACRYIVLAVLMISSMSTIAAAQFVVLNMPNPISLQGGEWQIGIQGPPNYGWPDWEWWWEYWAYDFVTMNGMLFEWDYTTGFRQYQVLHVGYNYGGSRSDFFDVYLYQWVWYDDMIYLEDYYYHEVDQNKGNPDSLSCDPNPIDLPDPPNVVDVWFETGVSGIYEVELQYTYNGGSTLLPAGPYLTDEEGRFKVEVYSDSNVGTYRFKKIRNVLSDWNDIDYPVEIRDLRPKFGSESRSDNHATRPEKTPSLL